MFELPSIWNLLVSTLAFFVAAWYFRRYLDEQSIPAGMTRSILVFTLASLVSWGSGELVDWTQGTKPAAQTSGDLPQLLKTVKP